MQNNVDREDIFVEIGSMAEVLDLQCNNFPWCSLAIGDGVAVGLINKVGPCCADVGYAPVIGSMVYEKANIIVSCLVGIVMIELGHVSGGKQTRTRGNLPHQEDEFGH